MVALSHPSADINRHYLANYVQNVNEPLHRASSAHLSYRLTLIPGALPGIVETGSRVVPPGLCPQPHPAARPAIPAQSSAPGSTEPGARAGTAVEGARAAVGWQSGVCDGGAKMVSVSGSGSWKSGS